MRGMHVAKFLETLSRTEAPDMNTNPTASSPEHEHLGLAKNLTYGFQHVLTMYGGLIAARWLLVLVLGYLKPISACSLQPQF